MPKRRSVEVKVGIFVVVCAVLIAGMIMKFGKSQKSNAANTYKIQVAFHNVGGIVPNAHVMLGGVYVGRVASIKLQEDSRVRLTLAIYNDVVIRRDAKFVVNQAGLLGDRYVDVIPQSATAEQLQEGAQVDGSSSVDLTEAIRSVVEVLRQAAGTIQQIDTTVKRVDGAIKRVDESVLSTESLAHVSLALANVDLVTSNAVALTGSLRTVVDESRGGVSNTLGKLSLAADNINTVTKRVDDFVAHNESDVHMAAKNLAESAKKLNDLLDKLEKGEGTAGKLLVDPSLHDELLKLVQNWRRYGLLYKEGAPHKPVEEPKRGMTPVPARPAGKAN